LEKVFLRAVGDRPRPDEEKGEFVTSEKGGKEPVERVGEDQPQRAQNVEGPPAYKLFELRGRVKEIPGHDQRGHPFPEVNPFPAGGIPQNLAEASVKVKGASVPKEDTEGPSLFGKEEPPLLGQIQGG
jgi:hypothetical protein